MDIIEKLLEKYNFSHRGKYNFSHQRKYKFPKGINKIIYEYAIEPPKINLPFLSELLSTTLYVKMLLDFPNYDRISYLSTSYMGINTERGKTGPIFRIISKIKLKPIYKL